MSARATLATAARVATQLRRGRRTLAMVFLLPPGLLALLRLMFDERLPAFDRIATPVVGLFPLILMFLVTSIAMLRERTSGTLERLMSLPISRLDLLAGYGIAFAAVAALQGTITATVAFAWLGVHSDGPIWGVVALAIGNAMVRNGPQSLHERVRPQVSGRPVPPAGRVPAAAGRRPVRSAIADAAGPADDLGRAPDHLRVRGAEQDRGRPDRRPLLAGRRRHPGDDRPLSAAGRRNPAPTPA